jgi:hypothetical protein
VADETKQFHIGDVLSVMSGVLVSPEHIGGVYKLLGWMVRDDGIMTHQLPRVTRECGPFLRSTFPDLAAIDVAAAGVKDETTLAAWLTSLETEYGTHRDVPRLPELDHTDIDPLTELKMLHPNASVVIVEAPKKGGDRG